MGRVNKVSATYRFRQPAERSGCKNNTSRCLRLIFLLFDQKKRHAAARTVAARVKTNPDSLTEFATWMSDKSFIEKLKLVRQNPEKNYSLETVGFDNKAHCIIRKQNSFYRWTKTFFNESPSCNDRLLGFPQRLFYVRC